MDKRVFGYKSGIYFFVSGFLFLWSTIWIYGAVSGLVTHSQNVTIQGRQATPEEAFWFQFAMVPIGLAVLGAGVALLMYTINRRIVLERDWLTNHDWRGRKTVECGLNEIQSVVESKASNGISNLLVTTSKGNFKFDSQIRNYADLRQILGNSNQSEITSLIPDTVGIASKYVPNKRTFRYLLSFLHIFSFLWLGIIMSMVVSFARDPAFVQGSIIPFIVAAVLFGSIGVWMQMTGWIERITLGADGIEWIDWLGRVRVRASLEDIRDVRVIQGSKSRSGEIETRQGPIKFSSNIWGFSELVGDVKKIIDGRQVPERHLSPNLPQGEGSVADPEVSQFTMPEIEKGSLYSQD